MEYIAVVGQRYPQYVLSMVKKMIKKFCNVKDYSYICVKKKKRIMKKNEENKEFCPECGTPLEFAYERENGERVYYCPEGDEHYIFENKGEYRYATCLSDGKRFCVGAAK